MAITLYDSSQNQIAEAEAALRDGDVARARAAYARAAADQERLVEGLPTDRPRTRATYALSAATLFLRANLLDDAERLVCQFLADAGTEPVTRLRLRDLFSRIDNERLMQQQGVTVGGRRLSLWFKGPRIFHGLAPPELIAKRTETLINCLRRVAAALGGQPFTRSPRAGLIEYYEPLMTQPQAGSYRFDIHLAVHQLPLDLGEGFRGPEPDEVVDKTLHLLRSIESHRVEEVRQLLPQPDYQRTAVRLVRSMLPDGEDLSELQIRDPLQAPEHTVTLSRDLREPVDLLLDQLRPASASATESSEAAELPVGVLRALDLDSRKLRLETDGGRRIPIRVPDSVGDDEIAALANRRVRVRRVIRRFGKLLLVEDLEPCET